jgi:hypothetical protein
LILKLEQLKERLIVCDTKQERNWYHEGIDDCLEIVKASELPELDDVVVAELIEKVRQWWNKVYPADVFTGGSGDEGAESVAEIRALLDKVESPQWLDAPTEEGCWWIRQEDITEIVDVYKDVKGDLRARFIQTFEERYAYGLNELCGKWMKAGVPEFKNGGK